MIKSTLFDFLEIIIKKIKIFSKKIIYLIFLDMQLTDKKYFKRVLKNTAYSLLIFLNIFFSNNKEIDNAFCLSNPSKIT